MNREEIERMLCEWKWSNKPVSSIVDELLPLLNKKPKTKNLNKGKALECYSDLRIGQQYVFSWNGQDYLIKIDNILMPSGTRSAKVIEGQDKVPIGYAITSFTELYIPSEVVERNDMFIYEAIPK